MFFYPGYSGGPQCQFTFLLVGTERWRFAPCRRQIFSAAGGGPCSLALRGGGSHPAASMPSAPPVEASFGNVLKRAHDHPDRCAQCFLNVLFFLRRGLQFKDQHHFQMYFLLSEQTKDRCSMLLQWLVIVNRGRFASHTSTAVDNDSIHIVSKWVLRCENVKFETFAAGNLDR